MCPQTEVLKDPQLLVQKELQDKVLTNSDHSKIPYAVMTLVDSCNVLDGLRLCPNEIKQARAAIVRGKLAIGTHFCLKKLSKIQALEGDAKAMGEMAKDTLAKVKEKGIVVSSTISKALTALSAVKGK